MRSLSVMLSLFHYYFFLQAHFWAYCYVPMSPYNEDSMAQCRMHTVIVSIFLPSYQGPCVLLLSAP